MKTDITPAIHSFIIRFVVDEPSDPDSSRSAYRGAIRHIQNAEELNFNEWGEAVEFMRRFVPIETLHDKPDPQEKKP